MELKVQKLVSEKYLEKPRCRKERCRSVLRDMTVSILDLNIRGQSSPNLCVNCS